MAKRKRPNLTLKVDNDISKQEEILSQLQKEDEVKKESHSRPKKEKTKRFTMDFPISLHATVAAKAASRGQTIKGYLLTLIWKDLEE